MLYLIGNEAALEIETQVNYYTVFFLKLCQKIGQSLEESLQGGKLVKNFKIIILNE